MGLCQLCLSLDFASIMQTDPSGRYVVVEAWNKSFIYFSCNGTTTYPGEPFVAYHRSLSSLSKSSKICDLCRLFEPSIDTTIRRLQEKDQETRPDSHELFLTGLKGAQGLQVVAFDKGEKTPPVTLALVGCIRFFVNQDNPLAIIISGRKPPASPRSTMSLNNINDWLLKCASLHNHGKKSAIRPTRLLRYEEKSHKVILCDSIPSLVKYAALSHCWGSVQPLTLNCQTIKELGAGIPMKDLPQTFQDALWLTYQLQIPYLWVDSLCILQDDPEDWVRESSLMCDVYGNAFLTIAATRAENSSQGFLGSRSISRSITIPFHIKGISSEVSACLLPEKLVGNPDLVINMEDAPLSRRAWVIQERYLAPRTLHFTDSQTYFECDLCFIAEDGGCTRTHPLKGEYTIGLCRGSEDKVQRMRTWRHIVERYTRRSLTVENDRLPAIAGLATRFALKGASKEHQSMLNSPYLAGLWKEDFLRGMCWEIDNHYPVGGASSTYIAPSWSWASVKSAIEYTSDWLGTIEELSVVQSAGVDLEDTRNAFGKVTGGWVHLSVIKLQPYQKDGEHYLWFREGRAIFRVAVTWDSARCGLPAYNHLGESIDHKDLVAIPLGWAKRNIKGAPLHVILAGPFFLIVMPAQTDTSAMNNSVARYRRVGFGRGHGLLDRDLDIDKVKEKDLDMGGVRKLIQEKFTRQKEGGRLEDIIIL